MKTVSKVFLGAGICFLVAAIVFYASTRGVHGGWSCGAKPPFPIDAVYTWVDSSDKAWQQRRVMYAQTEKAIRFSPPAHPDLELATSVRLALKFMPWLHRIYIVTDQQTPRCLFTDEVLRQEHAAKRIRVLDHSIILPETPVFNSHAIEAGLHRIPGLSDKFIYFNDDVFVLHSMSYESFYTADGKPLVSGFQMNSVMQEAGKAFNVLQDPIKAYSNLREACSVAPLLLRHVPHPMTRRLMRQAETELGKAWRTTLTCKLRKDPGQIPPIAATHTLAIRDGEAQHVWAPPRTLFAAKYLGWASKKGGIKRLLHLWNPSFACFNDLTDDDVEEAMGVLREML